MENEVAVPQGFALSMSRSPGRVLAEAKEAAKALTDIIRAIPEADKVLIGGKQYIEFDHWQLVGRFYGCTPKVISTEYVEIGNAKGFLSKSVVIDAEGREISAADAMCMDDEEHWAARPKYEWQYVKKSGGLSADDPGKDEIIWEPNPEKPGKNKPKKQRVHVGEEKVPLNQIRSMAQTRSGGKALRNVFSWVVVLAGYAPTPLEEMTGNEGGEQDGKPKVQQPTPKVAAQPAKATEKPKADLTYETILVAEVAVEPKPYKDEKKKGQTWDCYTITAASGWTGWCYDNVGKQLLALKGGIVAVQVGFTSDRYGNKILTAQEQAEPVGA